MLLEIGINLTGYLRSVLSIILIRVLKKIKDLALEIADS
jgi:hypothetical protein